MSWIFIQGSNRWNLGSQHLHIRKLPPSQIDDSISTETLIWKKNWVLLLCITLSILSSVSYILTLLLSGYLLARHFPFLRMSISESWMSEIIAYAIHWTISQYEIGTMNLWPKPECSAAGIAADLALIETTPVHNKPTFKVQALNHNSLEYAQQLYT